MMIEAGPGDGEIVPSVAPTPTRPDFSLVQGFQVVGADLPVTGQSASNDEHWRDALRLELETRATRFHHAVDSAIVLSNEGVIRWLGDPIARLSPGPDVLTPAAVILADEALPVAGRDVVKTRVDLWLAAMTRRILGPLFALETFQEGSEVVRDLAGRLARSLGILEREPIREQIKALAQNERAELRKLGVRFGAHYIFLPALIKPAARVLALQLWGLQASGDASALIASLAQVAISGRTSLALDSTISREGYRVVGYRPCGERIVRVDVLERLAGMIRAAIVERQARAPGAGGPGKPNGFVVSGQMTSLTGCAGEPFASILRSMGFRSVEMKRSEFVGSSPPAQASPPPPTLDESSEVAPDSSALSPTSAAENIPAADLSAPLVEASPSDGALPDTPSDGIGAEAPETDSDPSIATPPPPTGSEDNKNSEMIVVWRPSRNAFSRHSGGDKTRRDVGSTSRDEHSPNTQLGRPEMPGSRPPAPAWGKRNMSRHEGMASSSAKPAGHKASAARPDRREPVRFAEKHRQTSRDRDMPRSHSASERESRATVDPNSPFAKLLELRSLLEEQTNKRP